jgi:ubiquinone/menaquinone biosynthesis C-methylase UbiE
MASVELLPAGAAFDAVAESFDARFDKWLSVELQRNAVREELLRAFPRGSKLLEIGGGTGTDAAVLIAEGREVLMTDASPSMVAMAARKIGHRHTALVAAENLAVLEKAGPFDGVYSNFAALNCVSDLTSLGRALACLIRPGGKALLVVFGCLCPNEVVVEALRGRFRNCLRRFRRNDVMASLGGREFTIRYHRQADLERAMVPEFRLRRRVGIGVTVPPSAAEPWASGHPLMLKALARIDRVIAEPLAGLADHILYEFERVDE